MIAIMHIAFNERIMTRVVPKLHNIKAPPVLDNYQQNETNVLKSSGLS